MGDTAIVLHKTYSEEEGWFFIAKVEKSQKKRIMEEKEKIRQILAKAVRSLDKSVIKKYPKTYRILFPVVKREKKNEQCLQTVRSTQPSNGTTVPMAQD